MKYFSDKRIVLTLDAGGTNFAFSAIRGNKLIVKPKVVKYRTKNLDESLNLIVKGFKDVQKEVPEKISAISFAFPGPANYPLGIIEDLPNLPAFKGGVALGPMLEEKFNVPVFINNDGNLFALGEAIGGLLPYINHLLKKSGSTKRFNNLLGVTIGTGFGGGIVINGNLLIGDNSGAGEIWLLRNKLFPATFLEKTSCSNSVIKFYTEFANIKSSNNIITKEIYNIAEGKLKGNRIAAKKAFIKLGESIGDGLANAITLIDGLVVIGGGVSAAYKYFLPEIVKEMNRSYDDLLGNKVNRLECVVFNLTQKSDLKKFLSGEMREIKVPDSDTKITYDALRRTGVGITKLGTTKAVAIGAYCFALSQLDKNQGVII